METYREIRIVFKNRSEIKMLLHNNEAFEDFWVKVLEKPYFITYDVMFNTSEVVLCEEIIK